MNLRATRLAHIQAFSLIEVVLALGICTFAIVALVGLFGNGIQASRDSEDQIQAANLASLIIATRRASPTNTIPNSAIPASAMTNLFTNAFSTATYVGFDGKTTNAANAAYQVTCKAGTNAMTGRYVSQVYLMLSWPVQMNTTNLSLKQYELLTYIPTR